MWCDTPGLILAGDINLAVILWLISRIILLSQYFLIACLTIFFQPRFVAPGGFASRKYGEGRLYCRRSLVTCTVQLEELLSLTASCCLIRSFSRVSASESILEKSNWSVCPQ
jgi:uncharacterized membrane protein